MKTDLPIRERDFQRTVMDAARTFGWRSLHEDAPARRCHNCGTHVRAVRQSDHPDLELVRGPQLLYLELKSEKGVVTPGQQSAIDALKQVRYVAADIVRPKDWPDVEDVLKRALR